MKRFLFYLLSYTWGAIMTLIGAIITGYLALTGHPVQRHGWSYYVEVGEHWGGVEFGIFFLC